MSSTDDESIASNESELESFFENCEGKVESNDCEDEMNHEERGALPFIFQPQVYKYLGPKNRCVIPSCVVWKIRDTFPDEFEKYASYQDSTSS